jgi:hypothetical protein
VSWLPLFAVALTATTVPAFTHSLAGLIDPSLDGLAAVVREYWVVNVAVYVAADPGAVIECDWAPPSDHSA